MIELRVTGDIREIFEVVTNRIQMDEFTRKL
jgi:hypothetical protein